MPADNLSSFIGYLLNPWILIGFFGQFLFFMRFIVQWIATERAGRVVVPRLFWYFSISGALVILIYSIYRRDIVFITAQVLSLFIYARNLMLERRMTFDVVAQSATENKETNFPE